MIFDRQLWPIGRFVRSHRRQFLQVGVSSLAGLSAAANRALATPQPAVARRADSVLLVYLTGGASQHDTFDMKPECPAEIRGEFQAIQTSLHRSIFVNIFRCSLNEPSIHNRPIVSQTQSSSGDASRPDRIAPYFHPNGMRTRWLHGRIFRAMEQPSNTSVDVPTASHQA